MGVKYLTRSVAVLLVLLLFLFVGLWFEGYQYSLAKSKLRSFETATLGGGWTRPRMYDFWFVDSGVLKGKVRVGEQVTVVKLGIKLIYMNSTILDRFGLTFRIFLNRETDYPNRSRAIIIESSHTYRWSDETWMTKLNMTFNETLRFGDQITQVDPGQEIMLKLIFWYDLDAILYYKNQSVMSRSVGGGGAPTEIIVENLQNPMLTYFLENEAEGIGRTGTVVTLVASATAVILWKVKKKR